MNSFNAFDRYVLPHYPLIIVIVALLFLYVGVLYYRNGSTVAGFGWMITAVVAIFIAGFLH
ncbi:hypothetical protein A374_16498 [Fictibacillus macauensis ZFHKF-1]|uniref:Uncharacterized protein n=1 Tax=Fictibacillus macauensis ZFHKF-1 TaxID=1196324 RepID=I8IXK3_9BACL|nr:hypothetical protein [Fictibacillus macauensis]EIT84221.1 hypothetical protein A374_16498 [Fictibacillus macauensis ZFHKF-1]